MNAPLCRFVQRRHNVKPGLVRPEVECGERDLPLGGPDKAKAPQKRLVVVVDAGRALRPRRVGIALRRVKMARRGACLLMVPRGQDRAEQDVEKRDQSNNADRLPETDAMAELVYGHGACLVYVR